MSTITTEERTSFLVLTACHHGDQEFYEIGRVPLEVSAETFLARLPDTKPHDCDKADMCLILDYWPDEATGISDDREITLELANALFDGRFAERLQQARVNLDAIYATIPGGRVLNL